MRKTIGKFCVLILLLLLSACHFNVKIEQDADKAPVNNVAHDFVKAYNLHDSVAMLALVHDDIKYMYIDGGSIYTETKNKIELTQFLSEFFNQKPNAQSEVVTSKQNDRFIHQVEKALWKNDQGELKAQCSLSVYELKEELIINVWYYAAYQCMVTNN